jgi:HAD superfamily hydrolase (TIGR01509 family)
MTAGSVLLDVDGTLVDSNWIHTLAWSRALRSCGVEGVAMARIHPLVGMGADRLVEALIGRPVDGASDAHHEEYERLRPDVRPLPGARDLVRALHDRGLAVVLASSSKEDELAFLREVLEVDDWIVGATSSDDAEASKPAPDIFAAALEVAGGGPAAVVGDTRWDVEAAAALDLPAVVVLTGGGRPGELRAAGAAEVHDDPAGLLAALDDSLLVRLA